VSTPDDVWADWDARDVDAGVTYIGHARAAQPAERLRGGRDPLDFDSMLAEALVREKANREARRLLDQEETAAGSDPYARMVETEEQRLKARLEAQARVAEQTQARREVAGLAGLDLSRAVRGGEFLFGADADLEPIWGSPEQTLWAAGEAVMIHGPQGTGKTTLAQQLVKGLLGLQPEVLGFAVVPNRKKVLYLAMDRPRQAARAMKRLYTACTEKERAVVDDRLVVWKGPLPAPLLSHPALLRDLARQFGCDVIVVDSLKDAVAKLSDDEHGSNYNTAIQMCLVAGIQVCDLHHPRKASADNASKAKSVDDIYGSTWLTAGHGSIVNLWGKTGDLVVELSMLKLVNDDVGLLSVVHDHEAGVSQVQEQFDMLQTLVQRGSLTAAAAAALMVDGPKANDVEKARRRLRQLVKAGLADEEAGARGGAAGVGAAVWRPTEDGLKVAGTQNTTSTISSGRGFGGGAAAGSWASTDPF
jgi:replicative DNA helicase